jgi:malonyl-CoA decarboxylase
MNERSSAGFLERTLRNLRSGWRAIAGAAYDAESASLRPHLPDEDAARVREQMQACLGSHGGEVSARARAAALGHVYLALDSNGRRRFLTILAEDFGVDHGQVLAAADALRAAADDAGRRAAEIALKEKLEAPRVEILRRFNGLPQGVKFLVDMRAELLAFCREDGALKPLEEDLRRLLRTWFDVDFLELRRIAWDTASGTLLEKLIAYEAVHAIESWDDLKNRLDSDRRCFAYFHPRMPNEPLIFVEVALVSGLASNIRDLLDEEAPVGDPGEADTAIFYSISSAQKGLAGISFGHFLIKRVADVLSGEFPALKTFATLSPIPGFRDWLDDRMRGGDGTFLLPSERKALAAVDPSLDDVDTVRTVLAAGSFAADAKLAKALKAPLMRWCARYLMDAKTDGGRALDPVAHFHLSNGARMERLNWLADRSPRGIEQSAGMMINYLYRIGDIDANYQAYAENGEVAASGAMRALLKG